MLQASTDPADDELKDLLTADLMDQHNLDRALAGLRASHVIDEARAVCSGVPISPVAISPSFPQAMPVRRWRPCATRWFPGRPEPGPCQSASHLLAVTAPASAL